MELIFKEKNGEVRCIGYSSVSYSSDDGKEIVVQINEDELGNIFANSGINNLPKTDESIDAAVDDPLAFRDYLILDSNDAIVFDPDYAREDPTSTST